MLQYFLFLFLICVPSVLSRINFPSKRRKFHRVRQEGPTLWGEGQPSSLNCTWGYFNQTLDHFSTGATPHHGMTYMQRYCIYDKYWDTTSDPKGPILFYTGNESPVEEYVNNTGLMWTLAPKLGALLLFAEHRYEGKSVPPMVGVPNCESYCTSAQALADFATLIQGLKDKLGAVGSPVIAFGGSYGGMLTAWFRMKYPNIVAGGIAASAPIWGTPMVQTHTFPKLGGSSIAISRGVSKEGGATDQCRNNIHASWPLIHDIGKTSEGRALLSTAFNLCRPLKNVEDVSRLISYGHGPWFEMAEGDYPFPSTYITFAVGPGLYPLPAWPMRVACQNISKDFGVKVTGSVENVKFTVTIGDVTVTVDWDKTEGNGYTSQQVKNSGVLEMISGLRDGVGVWYNVTGKLTCYMPNGWETDQTGQHTDQEPTKNIADDNICTRSSGGSWGKICCNENLNLINTEVSGTGKDMFWPPSVKSPDYTIPDLIGPYGEVSRGCGQYDGLYGFPAEGDNWSRWLDAYYGGINIAGASNIIFSNGLLDPWWSGGVLKNISDSLIALELPLGAHHLDLFFPTANDPPDAIEARLIEETHIRKWIKEAYADYELLK